MLCYRITLALAAAASTWALGCAQEKALDLELISGMDCRCSTGSRDTPLFKTVPEPARPASFVIEFVEWPGDEVPGCRVGEIRQFCMRQGCAPVEGFTECIQADGPFSRDELPDPAEVLAGFPSASLPPEPGMIRLVGTRQSCEEVSATGLEPSLVFGCAHTCPLRFEDAASPVLVGLDSFGGCTEWDVGTCAFGLATGGTVRAGNCPD